MLPPFLKAGDTVSIVSPSGAIDPQYIDGAVALLSQWGLKAKVMPHAKGKHGRYSGTAEERIADLQAAIDDPETQAVLCSRGGYGLVQIIDQIDIISFENKPKWIIGFSDITVLHNLCSSLDTASLHSIMAKHMTTLDADSEPVTTMRKTLFGDLPTYKLPAHKLNRAGSVDGRLIGGNLSLVNALRATTYDIDPYSTPSVLFLEDVGERPYKIDSMMNNLRLSGVLENIKGLVVGQFSDYEEDEAMGGTVYELIREMVDEYDYPVLFDFPAGHVERNLPLILGARVELEVKEDGAKLNFNCKQPKVKLL
ncbi:MAG: LD-carboxypeptidase [Paludibacteraceae bacterium]|nr:LD-carboxypeptidase [Paludibacteraceae bacterium]MBO7337277.1 LD-carboxypeptidase [Paludibacteraceae bacterium]MBP5136970.1 LD-carboxypeptidase [Paludibacteraceae bacterium]MBP5741941.1 LD-carboxypeptidase [Paludibacteraceae bacterium]